MYKIAVIDDDHDIVEATTILLQSKGYDVISAGNAKAGYELVKNENPNLIVLDVMMEEPDDGFFLAMKLRKDGFKMPIIMFTSVSKALGMNFAPSQTLPVDDFIEKPVAPSVLLTKIVEQLNKAEA
jgi:DNA-binding response OmpR family regulator